MEKNEVLKLVAAVVTTVDEVDFAPESMVYMGLGVNLDQWYTLRGMLTGAGLVTAQYDTLTITPAGHTLAGKINAAMKVTMLDVVPFAFIWVPESQGEDYKKYHGDKVITIPDELDGNSSRKFNAVLDRSPCPYTLILDDDIRHLAYWERKKRFYMSPDHLVDFICHHFEIAEQLGVKLWGVNQNKDPMIYNTFAPYSFLAPVLGPITGHLHPILRYDERIPLKEDYDFWLQNIRKYHFTLRANKYHYEHDSAEMAGGCVSMRTQSKEEECARLMREKWGKVYSYGGTTGGKNATGKNILNSNVKVPLKGI